ncbi:sigma factor [Cupriavidus sp. TMH.W2]|uniref:sigma factor n=1 Tax=Cupriavidus sp. TMH.W2 TaxID=3434465 RepID=UPI003D784DF7
MSLRDDLAVCLPHLRRYARALTGDGAWADDLVQDTVERALGRTSLLRAHSNTRAWLMTILRHLYIDQLRKRRELALDADAPLWQRLGAPAVEVDGLLLLEVQRALYRLPLEQREVLLPGISPAMPTSPMRSTRRSSAIRWKWPQPTRRIWWHGCRAAWGAR